LRALIFGGGEINDYGFIGAFLDEGAFIICADGGLKHADALGLAAGALIGDFDSVDPGLMERYVGRGRVGEIIRHNPEKDFTDMELAVGWALERGFDGLVLLGATGSRLDHTLGNIYLLNRALEAGKTALIADERHELRLIRDELRLSAQRGSLLSLLPLTPAVTGVTTRGLYYPLNAETLVFGSSRGVSNVFLDTEAYVSIESGLLLSIITGV